MTALHLWMPAVSDQGEKMQARVERVDKIDKECFSADCSVMEFRGSGVWHQIVRRYDPRNTADRDSAHQRQGPCEQPHPQDVHQRNQLAREPVGKIRDEQKTPAVMKLMPSMMYDELITALESIQRDIGNRHEAKRDFLMKSMLGRVGRARA